MSKKLEQRFYKSEFLKSHPKLPKNWGKILIDGKMVDFNTLGIEIFPHKHTPVLNDKFKKDVSYGFHKIKGLKSL